MTDYKVGDIVKCRVSGITKYGVFVHVDLSYSGLIHISEISNEFVNNVEDFVKMGEYIYCEVLDVDASKLHLKLSIKNINYKVDAEPNKIQETRLGFLPLKNALPDWIDEALNYYKNEEKN